MHMKKFLQTLMVVAVLCLPTLIHAQVSTYTFNTGVDASKWRALSASAWDTTLASTSTTGDAFRSQLMNIGFSFNFGGTSYTQFSMNSDGCLRLGPVVTGTANYTTPFSTANASANSPKILGIGRDGRMRGPSSGYIDLGCYLAYEVQGTAPNRVLVAEFNVAAYTSTTNCVTKWQVQLHEGSNAITIIYDSVPTETTATGIPDRYVYRCQRHPDC